MINKLFLFVSLCSITLHSQDSRGYIVKVGETAPIFKATTIDGNEFELKKHRGQIIMLQFTASWCSVCMKEMPFIEKEIWQKHKNNDKFVLLALAKDSEKRRQGKEEIELMVKRTGVTYPIGIDQNSEIFNLFSDKKAGVTRNVIIDKNGKIVFLTRLFEKNEFNEMKTIIEELLIN